MKILKNLKDLLQIEDHNFLEHLLKTKLSEVDVQRLIDFYHLECYKNEIALFFSKLDNQDNLHSYAPKAMTTPGVILFHISTSKFYIFRDVNDSVKEHPVLLQHREEFMKFPKDAVLKDFKVAGKEHILLFLNKLNYLDQL